MSGYDGRERREHERYGIRLHLHVAELGRLRGALTRDLSEGGMLVETASPKRIGSLLPLTLIHPSGEELPVITEVVRHVKDASGAQVALGLRFHQLDDALTRRLKRFVQDLVVDAEEPRPETQARPQQVPPNPDMAQPETHEIELPMRAIPRMVAMTQALDPMLLHLVVHVNGKNTVEAITRRSGLRVSETLEGLRKLIELGVIMLRKQGVDAVEARDTVRSKPQPTPAPDLTDNQQEKARQFAKSRVTDYLDQAQKAQDKGELAEAIRLLELALTFEPPSAADIHRRLARLAFHDLLDVERAEEHAIAALTLNPELTDMRTLLGEVRGMQGLQVGSSTRETRLGGAEEVEDDDRDTRERRGTGGGSKALWWMVAAPAVVLVMAVVVLVWVMGRG